MDVLDIISGIVGIICIVVLLFCLLLVLYFLTTEMRAESKKRQIVLDQLNETLKSVKLLADKRIEIINAYNDIDYNK